jgi:hypothetical protein
VSVFPDRHPADVILRDGWPRRGERASLLSRLEWLRNQLVVLMHFSTQNGRFGPKAGVRWVTYLHSNAAEWFKDALWVTRDLALEREREDVALCLTGALAQVPGEWIATRSRVPEEVLTWIERALTLASGSGTVAVLPRFTDSVIESVKMAINMLHHSCGMTMESVQASLMEHLPEGLAEHIRISELRHIFNAAGLSHEIEVEMPASHVDVRHVFDTPVQKTAADTLKVEFKMKVE